jgi:hypothetical protein
MSIYLVRAKDSRHMRDPEYHLCQGAHVPISFCGRAECWCHLLVCFQASNPSKKHTNVLVKQASIIIIKLQSESNKKNLRHVNMEYSTSTFLGMHVVMFSTAGLVRSIVKCISGLY